MMGKGRSCGATGAPVLVWVSAFVLSLTLGCDTPFTDVLDDDWWPFTTVAGETVYNDDPNLAADPNGDDTGEDPEVDPGDDPESVVLSAETQMIFVLMNTSVTITLTAQDGSGDDLTYSLVTTSQHGTMGQIDNSSEQTASIVYTPGTGYSGLDTFRFTVSDAAGDSSATTITIVVYPPVEFTVEPLEGRRPLTVDCSAPSLNADFVTEATYIWRFDDIKDAGLIGSHLNRSHVFQTAGVHVVTLTLSLAGSAAPLSCISAQTHTHQVNVVVWPEISGRVIDGQGVGIAGATVAASAGGTTGATDTNGHYVVDVPYNWTGVVGVQHNAYDFELASRSYANVTVDIQDQDFEAELKAVSITGVVALANGTGLAGAAISGQGTGDSAGQNATATTNSNGSYELLVAQGWAGQITATLEGYAMSPSPLAVSSLYSDLGDQDFVASPDEPDNDPPTATPGSVATNEDTAKSVALAGSDPEGTTLSFVIVTLPNKGALRDAGNGHTIAAGELPYTLNANGNDVTYTPQQNVNGQDAFTFKVSDGALESSAVAVEITINPVNDAPTADAQSVAAAPESATAITLTGSDVEQGDLSFEVVQGPSHGELTGTPPNISYTPAGGYEGNDAFAFKVYDGEAYSAAATVSITVASWVSPLGIPMPAFGITQKHTMYEGQTFDYGSGPEPYRDAGNGPYTHYVDKNHSQATDSSNTFGTPSKPRRTIPSSSLPAGSVVEVHGGPYDYTVGGRIPLYSSGTAAKPVFVRGPSAADKATFTQDVRIYANYMIVENLECKNMAILAPADHAALRHCEIGQGGGTALIVDSWSSGTYASHIVVYDLNVHDRGDMDADYDQDYHGVVVGKRVSNFWLLDSQIRRCSGSGLQINAGSESAQADTHHLYAGRCFVEDTRQAGLFAKQCVDAVFSQNTIRDIRTTSWSKSKGLGFQYGPERVWFLFNKVTGCEFGVYGGSTSGMGFGTQIRIIGNELTDIHHQGAYDPSPSSGWTYAGVMVAGGGDIEIVGNTIRNVDTGISTPLNGASLRIRNNIIANVTESVGRAINIEHNTTASNSEMSHCLFDDAPNGGVSIRWGGTVYTSAGSFAGCLKADPRFVDPQGNDLRLQANSPAGNAGTSCGIYETFEDRYGLNIEFDLSGTPCGAPVVRDIGAHECVD